MNVKLTVKRSDIHKFDIMLLLLIFCLFVFSLIAIYSGSGQYVPDQPYYYVIRQLLWYVIGIVLMCLVAKFDYDLLERWARPLYIAGVFFLVLVYLWGTEKNGAQRWLSFSVVDIQPSEFMKISLIIFISILLRKTGATELTFKESIPFILKATIYALVPFILIFVQPDLGSALVILGIVVTLLIVSNISTKMILLMTCSVITLVGTLSYIFYYHHELFTQLLKPHQLSRIYGWLDPVQYASDYGYQLQQAMMGIGSGRMTGRGFNEGIQVQSGRVPEAHTDFIFAVIGEEFGFIGGAILILVYFLLIYRIIQISMRANDLFGVYICIGVAGMLSLQIFQNIGMTIGVMPITGLALPFISYGGSALLTNFIALGLVLSVHIRSKPFVFSSQPIS